jgi:hypothetical protein
MIGRKFSNDWKNIAVAGRAVYFRASSVRYARRDAGFD